MKEIIPLLLLLLIAACQGPETERESIAELSQRGGDLSKSKEVQGLTDITCLCFQQMAGSYTTDQEDKNNGRLNDDSMNGLKRMFSCMDSLSAQVKAYEQELLKSHEREKMTEIVMGNLKQSCPDVHAVMVDMQKQANQ